MRLVRIETPDVDFPLNYPPPLFPGSPMDPSQRQAEQLLIERIRIGASDAWQELIDRYEGRLLAFVRKRLLRQDQAEDLVQETFIGFLTSLPNYDSQKPLEGYLLSIAAHKLTDYLRREGRRPTVPLVATENEDPEMAAAARGASSIYRSQEQKQLEERALKLALAEQIDAWRARGDWEKIQCTELLFVRGWPNKQVAEQLGLTEQKVANVKFEFLAKLKSTVSRQGISTDWIPD